ncbi:MAG: repair protein RecN [Actinomycetota bacterium]|jgi:DNA repair protein RecN (Recombination protein N)|nr:repair protein RecN [Actinomycetota bacterium]
MLAELHVRDLGVIADLTLTFGPGMTALTGETGAGKTLVVEAIELLVGGRADAVLVRPGAEEAEVEGRFLDGDREVVLRRIVPASGGRSRAYIDGAMATVAALADAGRGLVDLHGQHAHQSLLSGAVQRAALDAYASIDLGPLRSARLRVREVDEALAGLGGDARSRAREVDLLTFQVAELDAAAIDDADEDAKLEAEEDRLADADAARDAAGLAHEALAGDGGAADLVAGALSAIAGRPALAAFDARLRSLQAELSEVASELREEGEGLEDDPERLAELRVRRQLLRDLRRKYGDTLADVVAFAGTARARLDELASHEQRVAELEAERALAEQRAGEAAAKVAAARRKAAPKLAKAIEANLRELALPRARIEVEVGGDDPADDVAILFSANHGEPALPLTKVASGGELARTMLAARLVLTDAPPTLVFDEVDAGIGGTAAVSVGKALAALAGEGHQVLVVTHLPHVAAFADSQIAVRKDEVKGRTVAGAVVLDGGERVVELSRMLSGQPESATARDHAEELLASAAKARGR